MRWFGSSWGAPINEESEHAPTPVGVACASSACGRPILAGAAGVLVPFLGSDVAGVELVDVKGDVHHLAYHGDCFTRLVTDPDDLLMIEGL